MQLENIRAQDLNLLVLLDVLLDEKHISNAAERLYMSQPAVSRSLQRLRDMLNDPLLVRVGNGYQLTERAIELQPRIKSWLADFSCMLHTEAFDPHKAKGEMRIMSMDLEMSLFVPNLWQDMQQQAPDVNLRTFNMRSDGIDLLEQGEIDFFISDERKSLDNTKYHSFHLIQHDFVLVLAADHPLANKTIDLDKYAKLPHGIVTVTGKGKGFIDTALNKVGKKRKVNLFVPTFHQALDICSRTELAFSMPRLVVEKELQRYDVVMKEIPLKLPTLDIYLYWHERQHQVPMHRWFRTLMRESFEQTREQIRSQRKSEK
ncbi:MAG: LysR family transcriptional regulator [Kangiellaceae bacterium]|nr:LysR family transcriptional regulator [Kangiellaceae bacterium]